MRCMCVWVSVTTELSMAQDWYGHAVFATALHQIAHVKRELAIAIDKTSFQPSLLEQAE